MVDENQSSILAMTVRGYYDQIDRNDLVSALSLFADTAVYVRPGYLPMIGIAAIKEFFTTERIISVGSHVVENLLVDGLNVGCFGSFSGKAFSGERLEVRFADFWYFDSALQVTTRESFFGVPAV
ncbi:nuclear transport factor 2 family protein (plasmid) [Glutamicibacter sp. FR1]|uniref:nuclear transport factor 2 family protein n=1 Tax=Glutamicibacter sp. FR1 TaxID=3393744 RepID=UPI0039AEBCA5